MKDNKEKCVRERYRVTVYDKREISCFPEGNGDEEEAACCSEHGVDDRFQVNRLTAMPGHGLAVAKSEKDSKFRATLRDGGRQRRDGQNSYFPPPCRRVLAQAPKSTYRPPPYTHPSHAVSDCLSRLNYKS